MNKIKKKLFQIIKDDFFKTLMSYTLIFGALMLFMISIYSQYNKWFVWRTDGIENHFVTLRNFRDLLINLIRTGNFSTFTWNIANGFDLFANYTWSIFGDIFAYLSVFVKTAIVELLYNILIIIRVYFIGVSFLCYTKYKKMNKISSLIGTLMYTFSSYVLYASVRHPYFMNAVILFPLLMIGIEKIIKENKSIFYTIIIAITFISNFYFAYMMSVIIALYGIILAIDVYKKDGLKKIIKVLLKTLLYSLIGIMISAILLFPTSIVYTNSVRVSDNIISTYHLTYYRRVINNFLMLENIGYWVVMGIQSLALITVSIFLLRKRKENYPLAILLLILLLPILFAPIASIFAGFNYPNNRWTFIFAFIFSFMTSMVLNSDYNINKKDLLIIFLSIIIFLGIDVIFEVTLSTYTIIQILLIFVWLIVICSKDYIKNVSKRVNLYNILLIIVLCLGISSSIKYLYDIEGNGYVNQFTQINSMDTYIATSKDTIPDFRKAINYIKNKDSDFYIIGKTPYAYENVSILQKFNSIGSYSSIMPNVYGQLNEDLDNIQRDIIRGSKEFDYRTKATTLLGVKYLINYDKGKLPYGYSKIKGYKGESKIYENYYYLPFGVLYNSYITEEEYNKLSPLEKESSLLKTTVIEDNKNSSDLKHFEYNYSNDIKEIDYNIIDDNKIINDKNNITIENNKKNTFEIKIDNIENSELYVSFKNLRYEPFDKQKMIELQLNKESTLLKKAKSERKYKWYQPSVEHDLTVKYKDVSNTRSVTNCTSAYYMDMTDFLFNLGYYDKSSGKIEVILSKQGYYTFDDIKVYAVSMDNYAEDINNLRKSNFEVTEWDNGYLKGKVKAETDGILQFQTMYNDGWKVYVDGKKVDTLKSNKYFLGIEIGSGEHEIYMKYSTPYLKTGLVVSIVGVIIFIGLCVYNKKKKEN